MKKYTVKLCNILCAVLMLALLLCHLIPFWTRDGENTSLQEFIWFCTEHGQISSYLETVDPQFSMNSFIIAPILIFVSAVLGIFFCVTKPRRLWTAVFPIICGIAGTIAYLTDPVLQSGALWQLHLVVCVALLVIGIVTAVFAYRAKNEQEEE